MIFYCCSTQRNDRDSVVNNVDESISDTLDQESYNAVMKQFEQNYNKRETIDTTFQMESPINFKLTHYCLFDTLVIPAKYSWDNTPKKISTHNFESRAIVTDSKDTLVNVLIDKELFNSKLSDELKFYGVLLYPTFRGFDKERKVFKIHYSISIPLNDIGASVEVELGIDGSIKTIIDEG